MWSELSGRVGTGRADNAGIGRMATGHAGSGPADRAGAGRTEPIYAVGGWAELSCWWTWGAGWDVTVRRDTRTGGLGGVGRWAEHAGGADAAWVIIAGDVLGGSGGGRASP